MSRRRAVPAAEELFRAAAAGRGDDRAGARAARRGPHRAAPATASAAAPGLATVTELAAAAPPTATPAQAAPARHRTPPGDRRPTGREKHAEKITVYVSAEELLDLERTRLALRADHGLAVDRGRIVREALSVVVADLEAHGDGSILVRRLSGR